QKTRDSGDNVSPNEGGWSDLLKAQETYGRAPGQGDNEASGLKLKLGTPPSVPAVPPSDPTNSKSLAMIIKKSLAVSQPYD
ncbi:hypothetical protein GE21DRAFT_1037672, partial [Neurospora crassa]